MSQAISNLSAGTKVWINENSTPVKYEIAGFDVHASNTATLVRTDIVQNIAWGTNVKYSVSSLDTQMQAFENRYDLFHKGALISVPITCLLSWNDATTEVISRRVFALSYKELIGSAMSNGVSDGTAITWYTTKANRIKKYNGTASDWWTRAWRMQTVPSVYEVGTIIDQDGDANIEYKGTASGQVPAFVISSSTLVADSATSGAYSVLFADALSTATPIYPFSEYVQIDSQITFEWEHSIATNTDQTQADLQYRNGNDAWQTLTTVIGDASSATMPADYFPAGRLYWRVKTYNSDGAAGEWSDPAAFVGVGTPAAPTILSVSQCSRPVVTWSAVGQIAYRVQIGTHDTLEVAGTATSYKLPRYIANGTYAVKVAIKNASLVWSEWAETELVLNVTGPSAPTTTATASTGYATLSLSASGASKLYLLRDGVPIADVTGLSSYADHAALGSVSYVLRSVDSSNNYTDSTAATATVSVPYATIAAVDALSSTVVLKLTRGEPRRLSGSISQVVTYKRYAGRKKPVAVRSGQEDEAYQLSVSFLTKAEKDAFVALLRRGKTILYRDNWGNRWYVSIPTTGYEQDKIATSLPITMTVVDYAEEVSYAEV